MIHLTESEYQQIAGHTYKNPPKNPAIRMNKWETAYSQYLDARKFANEIRDYRFEPFKLILTHGRPGVAEMSYKPDFLVVNWPSMKPEDDLFEIHEVKGFMREDAQLKLKMAAELFPYFVFVLVTREKGHWVWRRY